ncbi:MAG: hypothetical protein IPI25_14620 [Candidatus Brocadia sp.]|nr:MAG: hypothetical protein IPI25_14620 [Candidatus Brocadia sp.]
MRKLYKRGFSSIQSSSAHQQWILIVARQVGIIAAVAPTRKSSRYIETNGCRCNMKHQEVRSQGIAKDFCYRKSANNTDGTANRGDKQDSPRISMLQYTILQIPAFSIWHIHRCNRGQSLP